MINYRIGDQCYRRPGSATLYAVRSWGLVALVGLGLGFELGLRLVSAVSDYLCLMRSPMW